MAGAGRRGAAPSVSRAARVPPSPSGLPRARARCGALLALAVALLALAGCGALFGRSPEDRQITIELGVPRAEAIRRTLATFRAQGYTVRETLTSASQPETEPFRQGDEAEAVFRAAITGSGERSQVVLTGTYRRRQLAGLVRGSEREVRRSDDALERALWERLYNLGLTIRRPAR